MAKIDVRLKLFARTNPYGQIIAGTVIRRKKRPAGSNWVELTDTGCCVQTTTTTTPT